MGFQTAWTELKESLIKKLNHLEELHEKQTTASEQERLFHKIQGLKIAVQDIVTMEKQYRLCLHENAIIYGKWDNREMYCPDCNVKFYDCSL